MSRAAKSVQVFAIYLLIAGLGFMLMPNMPLGLLGFEPVTQPWIRVVGLLLLILSYYYTRAARHEMREFLLWTAQARACVMLVFLLFVILGWAKAPLLLFGVIDLAAAIWTFWALKQS